MHTIPHYKSVHKVETCPSDTAGISAYLTQYLDDSVIQLPQSHPPAMETNICRAGAKPTKVGDMQCLQHCSGFCVLADVYKPYNGCHHVWP